MSRRTKRPRRLAGEALKAIEDLARARVQHAQGEYDPAADSSFVVASLIPALRRCGKGSARATAERDYHRRKINAENNQNNTNFSGLHEMRTTPPPGLISEGITRILHTTLNKS